MSLCEQTKPWLAGEKAREQSEALIAELGVVGYQPPINVQPIFLVNRSDVEDVENVVANLASAFKNSTSRQRASTTVDEAKKIEREVTAEEEEDEQKPVVVNWHSAGPSIHTTTRIHSNYDKASLR